MMTNPQPQPKTVGFKPGERNVFLHILTACNLSCAHCYINPQQHGTRTLDREELKSWIEVFATPGRKSNLILLGGEPTMHPDLPFAIETAKKAGYNVTVDSNGYLFHDILHRTSPTLLDYLSFSLDGPDAATNDPIRGEGSFATCTANIAKAVGLGYNVSVIYTVSGKNIAKLGEMVELLNSLGVKKFFIQVLGLRGNSAKPETSAQGIIQVSREEWLAVIPDVALKAAATGIHVTYPKVFLTGDEKFECAGNVAENFFVFPNGRVYQCPLCEDHPIHSYRIENDKLVKNDGLNEDSFFPLQIPEGCVMNKLLQPETIEYEDNGNVRYRISCCLLKQEIVGKR